MPGLKAIGAEAEVILNVRVKIKTAEAETLIVAEVEAVAEVKAASLKIFLLMESYLKFSQDHVIQAQKNDLTMTYLNLIINFLLPIFFSVNRQSRKRADGANGTTDTII